MLRCLKFVQGIVITGVLAGCLAGCGGVKTTSVKGKVTYNGKALAFGSVIFISEVPNTQPVVTEIQPDGSYEAKAVAVGPANVGVSSPDPERPMELRGNAKRPPLAADPKLWFPIPDNYSLPHKSGLKYTVVDGPNEHPIDLK